MQEISEYVPTIDSREVAEMVGKEHKNLIRAIKRYIEHIKASTELKIELSGISKASTELKIEPSEFFKESSYKDPTGRNLPCYEITKKGCEFIAHKTTGRKGVLFTAAYINRFHDMENLLKDIELKNLRAEVKELQKVKAENEKYKKSITGLNNAVKSYAWKERINPKIKKLSEMTGESENNILSQFYRILDRETYIKIDCFKTVYMLENDLPDCSTFEVLASFESSRNCFEFLIDKILELKQ